MYGKFLAYSKSFLSVMVLMIRCILYPGAHLFVTSGGKEQGASILHDKIHEICDLIPAFKTSFLCPSKITRKNDESDINSQTIKKNKPF